MPTQTRSSGRFSRPGTTQSRSSSSRFARTSAGAQGATRTSRSGGRVSRPMPHIGRRRSQPQPAGPKKALKAVGGMLPTAAAGKASKKTAKAGKAPLGLALVAGAGALAFSQRNKIRARPRGGDAGEPAETPVVTTTTQDTATVAPASDPITPTTPPTTGL